MPANYLQLSRVTSPTGITSPGNPTVIGVSVIDITPGSDGRALKRVTVQYTPPGSLGTFTGMSVYLDHPDSSGTIAIADGTQAADGTVAASGVFNPEFIKNVAYNANSPSFFFDVPAPAGPEFWRVYIPPSANNTQVPVVQFGLAGASPSYQFLVPPPAGVSDGREFAPIVLSPALSTVPAGWSANPDIESAASGDQYFQYRVTWGWPTFDQNFQTVGGVNVVLDDGRSRKVVDQIWVPASVQPGVASVEADALSASAHITILPGTTAYKVWLVSFNKAGQVNTIVQGLTPEVDFTITRNTGIAGEENCALVTPDAVHPLVTVSYVSGADGTSLARITAYFNAPNDPAFGGAEIVVVKPGAVAPYPVIKAGRLSPIETDVSQPASVQSWTFYVVSVDINNVPNTIVPGLTPSITLNVGSASGQLNISKVGAGFNATQFAVVAGAFTTIQLDAGIILTGILQVGYTGSTVSKFEVFDTLGSLIGFDGDDTGGSGYVGSWRKRMRIGGTSPSTAPLQADTSGNVTINGATFVLTANGITTTINNATSGLAVAASITSDDGTYNTFIGPYLIAIGPHGFPSSHFYALMGNNAGAGRVSLENPSTGDVMLIDPTVITINGHVGFTGTLAAAISAGKNVIGGIIY